MSDERKKVLEMLSDGKISVDDAERLLAALGEQTQEPADQGTAVDVGDIEQRIRDGVEGVRRTVRSSIPHLRTAIRDASPDVERIVEEATASIPGFIEDMTQALRDTFNQGSSGDDDRFPVKVERDFSESADIEPSGQLVLHNPRGRLEVITWDQPGVQADVHATVRSHDEATARTAADSVQLVQEPSGERLVLRPVFPLGKQEANYRLDITLHVPASLRLDVHTAHGDLEVAEMGSDLVLGNNHGHLRLAGTSGDVAVQHNHGSVAAGRVGGTFALNAHHSSLEIDEAVQKASINAHHGRMRMRRIGGDLALNSHHAPFEADEIHGSAVVNSHHGPLNLRQVGGDLTLTSHHGPVAVDQVAGSARLSGDHGPLRIDKVGGELSAQINHGPLHIGAVGKSAVVRSSHGPITLGPVQGEVTAEADRGPVAVRGAGGRVTVRASRGNVRVENPAGEVLVENSRASIDIVSADPVRSAYTLSNNRGNISVVLPEGSSVGVQGFVRRGKIDTDLPVAVSANGQQGQSVSGELGAGGPAIQAEVESGNLILRQRGG